MSIADEIREQAKGSMYEIELGHCADEIDRMIGVFKKIEELTEAKHCQERKQLRIVFTFLRCVDVVPNV